MLNRNEMYSMKPNYFTQARAIAGRWLATTVVCLAAIALFWQGASLNSSAMATPMNPLIIATHMENQAKDKADDFFDANKNFVRDTADKVKRTANKNASKVSDADDEGTYAELKAQRDADRIEKRANEDAARTQKAIDNTRNAVQNTIDNIKDALD